MMDHPNKNKKKIYIYIGQGKPHPLSQYRDRVILIVNVASKCGFTPQYRALEELYQEMERVHANRFIILGFPCNQFGGQEPASNEDIQSFCRTNYGVTFPVLAKVNVNGPSDPTSTDLNPTTTTTTTTNNTTANDAEHPLWNWLKKEKPGLLGLKRVKWNFEKFLIAKDTGSVVGRWASLTKPDSLKDVILKEIEK